MGWRKEPGCGRSEDTKKRLRRIMSLLPASVGAQRGSRTLGDASFEPVTRKAARASGKPHWGMPALNSLQGKQQELGNSTA